MTHTTRSTISLMGRTPASPFRRRGTHETCDKKRSGAHLLMEPKATSNPSGRENSNVRANSSTVVAMPSSIALVTFQNMKSLSIPYLVAI